MRREPRTLQRGGGATVTVTKYPWLIDPRLLEEPLVRFTGPAQHALKTARVWELQGTFQIKGFHEQPYRIHWEGFFHGWQGGAPEGVTLTTIKTDPCAGGFPG